MWERIGRKRKGSRLSHDEVNRLGDVARRQSSSSGSGNLTTLQAKSVATSATMPPWHQYIVEVMEDLSATATYTYTCRVRYYDSTDDQWKTQDTDRPLDSSDLGPLAVGDKLTAWWNEQRGRFIPVSASARLRPFELDQNLIPKQVNVVGTDAESDSILGHFLDDPDATSAVFYPTEDQTGAELTSKRFRLGLGRIGCKGWARWQPQAYEEEVSEGEDEWVGQWQVVNLEAAQFVHAKVSGGDSPGSSQLLRNQSGYAQVWWNTGTSNNPVLAYSGYIVAFYNSMHDTLNIEDDIQLLYEPNKHVWYTTGGGGESEDLLYPFEIITDLVPRRVNSDKDDLTVAWVSGFLLTDPTKSTIILFPESTTDEADQPQDGLLRMSYGLGRASVAPGPGTRGWARWVARAWYNEVAGVWVGQWQIVTLDAALVVTAKVTEKHYPSGPNWVERNQIGYAKIWWNAGTTASPTSVASPYTVAFFNWSAKPLAIGEEVVLFYDRQDRVWYAQSKSEPIRFELWTDLEPGDQATAYWLKYDGSYQADANVSFTVYDVQDRFRSLGKQNMESASDEGARGYGLYQVDSSHIEILEIQQQTRMIAGTLGGDLTTTTASVAISGPVAMDRGQLPQGTITGHNVYTTAGFEGDDGGRCVAAWNEVEERYEFIDVECPAE